MENNFLSLIKCLKDFKNFCILLQPRSPVTAFLVAGTPVYCIEVQNPPTLNWNQRMWVSHISLVAKPLGAKVSVFAGFDLKWHHRDVGGSQLMWALGSRIDFEAWECSNAIYWTREFKSLYSFTIWIWEGTKED